MKIRFVILSALLFTMVQVNAVSPKREFRGAWIATINQLDWPSTPGASAISQQGELIKMLDNLERLNFNAVIFQVRPAADAFYHSKTEPWSHWLTGKQGESPESDWDPLSFMVEECHKRGMELHAWFNPFRISQGNAYSLSEKNIAKRHPEWVVEYDHKQFLDPGIPEVSGYLDSVIAEVVTNYDIDAIHLDDYFYPYPSGNTEFPDTASFRQYGSNFDNKGNWRRSNVDRIVESLGRTIKTVNPKMKFGISPFGVWRNLEQDAQGSKTTAALTNYDNLYADVIKWQENKWIDYLMPQLYWEFGHPAADYATLCKWWAEHAYGRHIYVGLAAFKASEAAGNAWKYPDEIPNQTKMARDMKGINGCAFFRMQHLDANPNGLSDSLATSLFDKKALLPSMPWLDRTPPATPSKVKIKKGKLEWDYSSKQQLKEPNAGFMIYYSTSSKKVNRNNTKYLIGYTPTNSFELYKMPDINEDIVYFWVTAIDKLHNESAAVGGAKFKINK